MQVLDTLSLASPAGGGAAAAAVGVCTAFERSMVIQNPSEPADPPPLDGEAKEGDADSHGRAPSE